MGCNIPRLEFDQLPPGVAGLLRAKFERLGYLGEFFARADVKALLEALKTAGVEPEPPPEAPAGARPLEGMVFVFTGTLARWKRDQAKLRVESLGARTSGSVSKKTTHLVAGEDAGSKLDDARKHGVNVLTEDEFEALAGGPPE